MKNRRHHAFVLVELFVAIFIGVIVITATMSTVTHHLALLRMHAGFLRARLAALREMERVKNLTWANLGQPQALPMTTLLTDDPELARLLPNAVGYTYVCPYHPWRPAAMSRIRQIIVAVTLDSTTNPLPTVPSSSCYTALTMPNPRIIQLTTLIDEFSPWYP